MMKILYLHGLGSGAKSSTPKNLQKEFPECEIVAPELPISPKAAYDYIQDNFSYWDSDFDLVVGTSLGGFYAQSLEGQRKLIVNPAMFADEDIRDGIGLGIQPFFSERSDGAKDYKLDEQFISELAWIRNKIYSNKDVKRPDRLNVNDLNSTFGAFAENDELLHHYDDFCSIYLPEHAYKISGGHRMTAEVIHNEVAPLMRKILAMPPVPYVMFFDED